MARRRISQISPQHQPSKETKINWPVGDFSLKEGRILLEKVFQQKRGILSENGKGKYVNILKEKKEINVPIHNLTTTTEYLPKPQYPLSDERIFDNTVKYKNGLSFYVSSAARKLIRSKLTRIEYNKKYNFYLYTLHHIGIYPFVNKTYERFGKVPVHYDTLRQVIGSSTTEVLTNLKAWGIVYCDNRYIKGTKSMHYGLKGKYTTDIKNVPCRDMEFVKKVLNRRTHLNTIKDDNTDAILTHISKIKINVPAAIAAIDRMTTRSDGSPFKDEARLKGGLKNLVTNIQNEIFYARKDGFSGRVHTNLTTLPKIIRKYITVEEEPLVQVDMVSAQPMLFHSLAKDIVHDKKELERYKELVESGGFYEHFASCFSPDYDVKKKKLATLIQVFFDKPKLYEYKAQTKFKKDFPAMFDFIGIIKAPNYKNMALLLQTEEVDFMLGKVIPEFRRRFPETFFSTIHDSIVVKKSDGNKALEVMAWAYEQEGYNVKLGIEEF